MYRIKYISLAVLLGLGLTAQAQQEQSLIFQDDLFQSHFANPSKLPNKKIFINLPSTYINFSNTGFSFNDAFEERGDSLHLAMDNVLGKLKKSNYLQANAEIEAFSFGFRVNKLFFTGSYRFRSSSFMNYSKELVDLAWNGNEKYIGQTADIGPDFQVTAFHEFAIGGGASLLDDRLQVGGRLKWLNGVADISTARSQASLYTDPEIYQLRLQTDYLINSSVFNAPEITLHEDQDGRDSISVANEGEFNPQFLSSNNGFAVDLGATFHFTDRWTFGFSLVDLGGIHWNANVSNLKSRGDFLYEGIDISALVDSNQVDFEAIVDTLAERFGFTQTRNAYSTSLPTKLYLTAEWKATKSLSLGGLLYSEFYRGQVLPAVAVSARKKLGEILSVGAVYSYRNRRFDNLGVNLALNLGWLQLYLSSDNILPALAPLDARNTNLRLGMNFRFGTPDFEE